MSDEIALSEAERRRGHRAQAATPVRCCCRIRPGRAGACDRYANEDGNLIRVDPLVLLARPDLAKVAFVEGSAAWSGDLGKGEGAFVTGPICDRYRRHLRPIPTTSRRPSSSRVGTRASTW